MEKINPDLEKMAELYPTIAKASTEIINLQAILNLPDRAIPHRHTRGI